MYKLGIWIDYKNVPVVGSILNQFRVLYMKGVTDGMALDHMNDAL